MDLVNSESTKATLSKSLYSKLIAFSYINLVSISYTFQNHCLENGMSLLG